MTQIIEDIAKQSNGAHFYKCALQVNSAHYSKKYRGQNHGLSEKEYAKEIINKCIELGIKAIGITDHNNVDSIDLFKNIAKDSGVCVFPGFEIGSSEGVHVLCLYPPDTTSETLNRYLGSFEIHDTEPNVELSRKSFSEILSMVEEKGGVTIAAHITENKGLLYHLHNGKPRINAWRDKNLLAVQIAGKIENIPTDKIKIIENKELQYKREPGADENLAIAVINAKDISEPDDFHNNASWSWIKMSEISIEGLKQAFLDPDSRIRLSSDKEPEEHTEIVGISFNGSFFLDGISIHLNENLNVLIGGRGTGKSTIVESIRYVLGLSTGLPDARNAHESIVREVIKSGTQISLIVKSIHPSLKEYIIQRTVPNPPVVMENNGEILDITPLDVLPGIEVFGQHEISELTRNRDKLTKLLDRFKGDDYNLKARKEDLKKRLERSRKRIFEIHEERQIIEEKLSRLPSLEETLKRYRKSGLEEKLKEQTLLIREERILKSVKERIDPFYAIYNSLRQELPIDRVFLSNKALQDLPGKGILEKCDSLLGALEKEMKTIQDRMGVALQDSKKGLEQIISEWNERKKQIQKEYDKILRELQKIKVDGEEFINIQKQIEELMPLNKQDEKIKRGEDELQKERRNLLKEWEDVKSEEFRLLESAAKKINKKLSNMVSIEVKNEGNRKPLYNLLRAELKGRLSEAIESFEQKSDFSLSALADSCRKGEISLCENFQISNSQALRIVAAGPELPMRIEELDLPAVTYISLNTSIHGSIPQWQNLEKLSTGQKATAVLLILLLESNAPLIIDQPEDDLDNQFITDGIVPKIREEKRRRQFIFSTHNANIPVLGDAELIVGLTTKSDSGEATACIDSNLIGSIDKLTVREKVEEVLEGGREAFEMRRRKYGF